MSSEEQIPNEGQEAEAVSKDINTDQPLTAYQIRLLEIAMQSASVIPEKPYIKDRCRAQEDIVTTCLKLDQPKRALDYTAGISNWRKGLCHAHVAYYCAQKGYALEKIQQGLAIAEKYAQMDHGQKWRSDRIKNRIAQTYFLLGKPDLAKPLNEDLIESEKSGIDQTKASLESDIAFNNYVQALDKKIGIGGFDTTKSALYAYAGLYNLFYEDLERRKLAEEKIKSSWNPLPVSIRFELLILIADHSLNHADKHHALELIDEARHFLDDYQWSSETFFPLAAELVKMQFRAGEENKARAYADTIWARYQTQGSSIINIYRAESLRPLAEAYKSMDEKEKALLVYKKVVEEGADHPGKKPRAEDLSATCCSMAIYAVEPDEDLWNQIKLINKGLVKE